MLLQQQLYPHTKAIEGFVFEHLRLGNSISPTNESSTILYPTLERRETNVFIGEQVLRVTNITPETFLRLFLSKSRGELINFLSKYASRELADFIMEEKIVEPRELCSVLTWLERTYAPKYGQIALDAFFDPEEGFQFLEISFPQCNWDEWKSLAREIKEKIKDSGMHNIASKVGIVCLEALQEPRR